MLPFKAARLATSELQLFKEERARNKRLLSSFLIKHHLILKPKFMAAGYSPEKSGSEWTEIRALLSW